METTYRIVRYRTSGTRPRLLHRGLTLPEAVAHCNEHHGPRYYDVWEPEPIPGARRGFGERQEYTAVSTYVEPEPDEPTHGWTDRLAEVAERQLAAAMADGRANLVAWAERLIPKIRG